MSVRPANHFLQSFSDTEYGLVSPQLKSVGLQQRADLFRAGTDISTLYFPIDAVISYVASGAKGDSVEVGMVGNDGMVCSYAALGMTTALNQAIVLAPGRAATIPTAVVRSAAEHSGTLRFKLHRHGLFMLAQAQQSALCLAQHSTEQRFCQWLLRLSDLTANPGLPLTHELIAQMIGVRRISVTLLARRLQLAGLITQRRGHVQITDPDGMRKRACECYEAITLFRQELWKAVAADEM